MVKRVRGFFDLFGGLLFFLVQLFSVVQAQDIIDLKEQYDRGIAHYQEGSYQAAIRELEDVLPEVEKVYEDTASYYNLLNTLGDAYVQVNEIPRAIPCFYKVWSAYAKHPKSKFLEYGLFTLLLFNAFE